jgi:uncharacterized membrane protein YfcA
MKAIATSLVVSLAASPALAHPGHIAESGGHSHWLGLLALMAAVGLAAWLAVRTAVRRAQRSRDGL